MNKNDILAKKWNNTEPEIHHKLLDAHKFNFFFNGRLKKDIFHK